MTNNNNNPMNEMMTAMMNTMMQGMMQAMMQNMTQAMTDMFAPAPQETPAQAENKPTRKSMTTAEYLETVKDSPMRDKNGKNVAKLEVVVLSDGVIKLSKSFDKKKEPYTWTANYLRMKSLYPNMRYDTSTGGFKWNVNDFFGEFLECIQNYVPVDTHELTEDDIRAVKEHRLERERKQAEYRAKNVEKLEAELK